MTIECTPRGICSWTFELEGGGHHATAEFEWMREQGRLVIDDESHAISKQGTFSGQWCLNSMTESIFIARKSNAFTRSFEISGSFGSAVLKARSPFGRTMILQGDGVDGLITPAHPFTRRAIITGSWEAFRLAAFAFWLTVIVWRRAASKG